MDAEALAAASAEAFFIVISLSISVWITNDLQQTDMQTQQRAAQRLPSSAKRGRLGSQSFQLCVLQNKSFIPPQKLNNSNELIEEVPPVSRRYGRFTVTTFRAALFPSADRVLSASP